MKPPRTDNFAERLKTAAAAKKQLLEKLKSAPKPDDPEVMARRAEKAAAAAAKAADRAERERLKQEAAARQRERWPVPQAEQEAGQSLGSAW